METIAKNQTEKKLGEPGYINKNCWLANNLGYPPSKHCQYCELKLRNCLFSRYLIISSILAAVLLLSSFLIERSVSKILIFSIFALIIIYGYYFDKSTQKIIESSFAQKKAKESLEELSKNLQQKIDDQTKEIREAYNIEKKAKENLQKLDQQKNEFMMITQHHLRTPLTSIMGYASLLQEGAYGKVPKKIGEVVEKFSCSSKKLIRMVNDFLDLSQFQMGSKVLKLEPNVDVKEIIASILSELKINADKKKLVLKIEPSEEVPLKIQADPNKLQAAFVNIIDNSIKYTLQGGIIIQIKNKVDGAGKKIEIIVKDTGIGMDKEQLNNLFVNSFERGEAAKNMNVTGKGVGMYLSFKIIESHNGKIWAESEGINKGSAFHIELPAE